MVTASRRRQPHAVMDLSSRRMKARKIERLLGSELDRTPLQLLEVGCGSGGIAHYFGNDTGGKYVVETVDVADNRLVTEGFGFRLVQDTHLPFEDGRFDVVITNHVIEHVGPEDAQLHHLREILRVLRAGGVGYLAVPNRWALIEPHFRLPFLSWLPPALRAQYVRLSRRGSHYDVVPLTVSSAERLFLRAGFAFEPITAEALKETLDIERPGSAISRALHIVPTRALRPLTPLMPTLLYRLSKR